MPFQPASGSSLSGRLGGAFGTGIASALQDLSERKAEELIYQKNLQRMAQGYEPIFGKEGSLAFAALPPEVQKLGLQNPGLIQLLLNKDTGQQSQQSFMSALDHLPSNAIPQANEQEEFFKQLSNPLYQKPVSVFGRTPGQEQQQLVQPKTNEPQLPQEAFDKANLIAEAFTSPQEKREREKLELKKRQVEHQIGYAEKKIALQETKEFRKELSNAAREAREKIRDINRLEELDKEGVDSPALNEFLTRSGFDIPALRSASGEEFNKIINNFVRYAKSDYGARLTDFDLKQFFQRLVTLSNSKEGRKRIYANMKLLENSKLARKEAEKEITKENNGIPPIDLEDQIEDRVGAKLDKLAEKFKQDLAKPITGEEYSKLATAAGALGGEAVRVGGPAITGAALGSFIPGIGTAAGGAAGAGAALAYPYLKKLFRTSGGE